MIDLHKLIELRQEWIGLRPWKRHSLVLLVSGLIYMLVCLTYLLGSNSPTREVALQIALSWWSMDKWGLVFFGSGLLAVLSARWPPFSETWGYFVLTGLSSAWAAFYATGVIFGDSPTSNLSGTLIWGLLAFLWWGISGLVNPTVVIVEHISPAQSTERLSEALREAEHRGHDERS